MVYREAERIRSAENTFSQDAFSQLPEPERVRGWKKIVRAMTSVKPVESGDECRLPHSEQGCQQMGIFAW
ncbi:hypothetical protein V5J35_004073 [Endozoicomonas sp. NE40]|uniref:Uncharacterized protein n=1 Tax=Endozoicomonas lisbonensis TaxID=3120522 RepID=A0ABV2SNN1_9GAMM